MGAQITSPEAKFARGQIRRSVKARVGVRVMVGVTVGVGVWVGSSVWVEVRVAVLVGISVAVGVSEGRGVEVSVGMGVLKAEQAGSRMTKINKNKNNFGFVISSAFF